MNWNMPFHFETISVLLRSFVHDPWLSQLCLYTLESINDLSVKIVTSSAWKAFWNDLSVKIVTCITFFSLTCFHGTVVNVYLESLLLWAKAWFFIKDFICSDKTFNCCISVFIKIVCYYTVDCVCRYCFVWTLFVLTW